MVPLPLLPERIAAEVVVGRQLVTGHGLSGGRLVVSGIRHAFVAHDGPVVGPLHGLQVRHTAHTTEVFLKDCPPFACGCVDERALVHGVRFAVDCLLHEHLFLVRTEDVLRAEHRLTAGPAAIGGIDIIVVANLVEVATLEARLVAYDALFTNEIEVLVELAHLNIADAAGHIDLAVVEEHAGVVVDARELAFLPATLGISGREEPSARVVAVDEEVELPVVILHRAGPHAGGVSILVVHEVVAVGRGELC